MTNKNTIATIVIGLMLLTAGFLAIKPKKDPEVGKPLITNFEECKNAGYPVMESYPEQCRDAEGNLFVRIIEETLEDPKDAPTPVATQKEFNTSLTYKIGDSVVFSDGLKVTLKEINDSRCKPDVQCIWAGELAVVLDVNGGDYFFGPEEIQLGTTNNKTKTVGKGGAYTFSLQKATETTATILVSVKPPSRIAGGYIVGHVDIGPICPVERPGQLCNVPPEVYTSREVVIYMSDKVTVKERMHLDAEGNYKMAIGPGNYFVQIVPAGIGEGEKKPVTVKSFETSTVNFDIDTGIR
ncbi:MAG: hypothetical protein KBC12_01440 [Candidatus Pacebacteria bacterium]|nr:hypothetical protein [Candidatus Paceibacterota bacterium]MBP9851471.1 hypothetical protein [Candidatus Paceibacterota bacterium]